MYWVPSPPTVPALLPCTCPRASTPTFPPGPCATFVAHDHVIEGCDGGFCAVFHSCGVRYGVGGSDWSDGGGGCGNGCIHPVKWLGAPPRLPRPLPAPASSAGLPEFCPQSFSKCSSLPHLRQSITFPALSRGFFLRPNLPFPELFPPPPCLLRKASVSSAVRNILARRNLPFWPLPKCWECFRLTNFLKVRRNLRTGRPVNRRQTRLWRR